MPASLSFSTLCLLLKFDCDYRHSPADMHYKLCHNSKAFVEKQTVICPQNEFDNLLYSYTFDEFKDTFLFSHFGGQCVKNQSFFSPSCLSCVHFHAWPASARHVFVHTFCVSLCIFMDAQLPAQTWHLVACSFEEQ